MRSTAVAGIFATDQDGSIPIETKTPPQFIEPLPPRNAVRIHPTTGYYSVRMHASNQGRHVSGAEDLVARGDTASTAARFVERALAAGPIEEVVVHVERLTRVPAHLPLLPLFTADVPAAEARPTALVLLAAAGVDAGLAETAMAILSAGAAGDGNNMRGAMLIDSASGLRLEKDQRRGVRARHFALTPELRATLPDELARAGYAHHRTLEGWLLATKMVSTPGALAELCWSDEPTYTTGYVALAGIGYVRLPRIKVEGDPHGGRALFLVGGSDPALATTWLEDTPCLVGGPVNIHPPQPLAAFMKALRS